MIVTTLPFVHPTVVHMLDAAAKRGGDRIALIFEGQRLTYRDYASSVARFARELQKATVPGDRIALICGNSLEMPIALFAVHAAGCQAVPVNPAYTARELTHILGDSEPAVVIHDAGLGEIIAPLVDELNIKSRIAVGSGGGRSLVQPTEEIDWPDFPAPDSLASLQYTGGTTGLSKGVNITHQQLSFNISQREAVWSTKVDEEIALCVMPLFHVFASSTCLHLCVYCCGTMVIQPRFHPEAVLDAIEEYKATLLPVGATVFSALMAMESFPNRDFSSLRAAYSGAAALAEDVLRRWFDITGVPILEGFGQSEGGPVLTANSEDGPRIPGSVGPALPNTRIEIVDLDTGETVLPIGEVGEIRAAGPQIMSGYRNRPEETAQALRNGWLYTGDIGRLDEAGNLYITDRKKDMAIVNGYNVYPREIDEVLFAHPDIVEAASVGVPDTRKGEVIHAYVVWSGKHAGTEEKLLAYCREQLAPYKVPEKFHIVDELAKTTVGKIDRVALRKAAAN